MMINDTIRRFSSIYRIRLFVVKKKTGNEYRKQYI
jgi:hypothetical protein